MAPLPPLKTDPKYGYFGRWPEDGDDWLHPDDVAAARSLIPSQRVFCRDGKQGELGLFHYGDVTFRARPALWQEVRPEGFEIGDWVEVLTRGMLNDARTGTIVEIFWDEREERMRYQLLDDGQRIEKLYTSDDLRHVEPTPPIDT